MPHPPHDAPTSLIPQASGTRAAARVSAGRSAAGRPSARPSARPPASELDYARTPFLVIWETTRACDLACLHCRAEAQPDPLPGELSHEEGVALIDAVADMGTPIMVLSGGDPLKRRDLPALIRHGKSRRLRMGTIPAATPLLTREAVRTLKESGLDQMALSLDASTAERHDRFRNVPGAYAKTLQAAEWAHQERLPLQINTVISRYNVDDVNRLIDLVTRLGIVFWEVFFLVPTGRGEAVAGLSAQEFEDVFAALYATARRERFIVKITEGPHFRRYYLQQVMAEHGIDPATVRWTGAEMPPELRRLFGPGKTIGRAPQAVNAGKGHAFVSYCGDVFPSGFLPVSAGNIRRIGLAELYRHSDMFKRLRDANLLEGRCGACEFRFICGGSRARAYALTGNMFAEEASCVYEPSANPQPMAG